MAIRNFSLILLVFCTGCCAMPTRNLSPRNNMPKRESVVFGEISLSSKVTNFFNTAELIVIDVTNSEIVLVHEISELGGPFYWHLPPGRYAILDMTVRSSNLSTVTTTVKRIYAEFSVALPSQLIYIGSLHINWRAEEKDRFVKVFDSYYAAVNALHKDYPKLQGVPVKSLMELEEDL